MTTEPAFNDALDVWKYVSNWLISHGFRIVIILVLAFCSLYTLRWVIKKVTARVEFDRALDARAKTLSSVLFLISRIAIWFVALLLVLGEMGIDLGPLLATAGVVGLAVGFGAQELVKDIISGFFILLEDQVRVGDVVDLDGRKGVIESINLRTVVLRTLSGSVHFVRNGNISAIENLTKGYSCYVLDIGVGYGVNLDQAMEIMRAVGEEMQGDPQYGADMLEPIEVFGLDEFSDSALVIKARLKTRPGQQWAVGREYRRRLKQAFDRAGVEIPFPHRTVYLRAEPDLRQWISDVGESSKS